jgi:hypothetical protein
MQNCEILKLRYFFSVDAIDGGIAFKRSASLFFLALLLGSGSLNSQTGSSFDPTASSLLSSARLGLCEVLLLGVPTPNGDIDSRWRMGVRYEVLNFSIRVAGDPNVGRYLLSSDFRCQLSFVDSVGIALFLKNDGLVGRGSRVLDGQESGGGSHRKNGGQIHIVELVVCRKRQFGKIYRCGVPSIGEPGYRRDSGDEIGGDCASRASASLWNLKNGVDHFECLLELV